MVPKARAMRVVAKYQALGFWALERPQVAIPLTDPGMGDASSKPDDDTGEADDCSLLDEFAAAAAGLSTDAAREEERVKPAFLTRKPVYLNYTEARKWARAMGMGSREEWEDWAYNSRRNPYIPRDPEKAYGDQFTDWDDWLGVIRWMPFVEARAYVRKLNFESMEEWYSACDNKQLPENIPAMPNYIYRESGWVSYPDWLGIEERPPPSRGEE